MSKLTLILFTVILIIPTIYSESSTTESVKIPSTSGQPEKVKINFLELVSGVGKAIQIMLNNSNQSSLSPAIYSRAVELGSASSPSSSISSTNGTLTTEDQRAREREDYRKRAEELRVDIAKRTAQLQKIVGSAIEVMKDRGDVMVKRILEHLNNRLDQARTSADRILKEPATSEMAVKTLNTINQGLNGVNSMITNLLNRVNIRINVDLKKPTETGEQAVKQN